MEIYLPTLQSKMVALVSAFRFIVFAILVVGLIAHVAGRHGQGTGLFVVFVKAIVIVAAIAYMDTWFPKVEQVFLSVAEQVDPGYNEHPTAASDRIRESTTRNPEGHDWSWRHINESIYQAMTQAMANIFIYVGTLITVPMLILQYVLRWLLYLLTPFMLALLLIPGFAGISVRFFQQILAIMAWPIGFSLTNLVALAVWTDFRGAVGANPVGVGDALYSPLLTFMGGILATIMIIVGMLSTPVVMQALFAQGHAFTGQSGNFAQMVTLGSRSISGIGSRGGRGAQAPLPTTSAPGSLPPSTPPTIVRPGI
ncbi:MAG: hypothetical protein ABI318_06520 [Chthoniobacteraceae bacterium]